MVNLKRNYSEFLGIKLKVVQKGEKYVIRLHMCDQSDETNCEKTEKSDQGNPGSQKCKRRVESHNTIQFNGYLNSQLL